MKVSGINVHHRIQQIENRNLIYYLSGRTLSVFGTAIYNFALSLYVLKLTGSALNFAVTLLLGTLPMIILNPIAGVLADKFNKKVIAVLTDLLNGLLLFTIYFLCAKQDLNLGMIYVTTFLLTVFTTFYGVSVETAKPNIVTDKRLMTINSVSKMIESASSILGPVCGGMVYALLDIRMFVLINAISFTLSAVLMLLIHFRLNCTQVTDTKDGEKLQIIKEIKEGFLYLMETKSIFHLFIIILFLNFFLGFSVMVPMPYIINKVLHLGSTAFGIVEGAFCIGIIIGALLIGKIINKNGLPSLLKYLSYFLAGLMIMIGVPVLLDLSVAPIIYTIFYSTVTFLFGIGIAWVDIPLSYKMQKEIPDEYRGRVLSLGISMGKLMLPVAMLVSGVLLNHLPSFFIPVAGGGLFLLLNMWILKKCNTEPKVETIIA